MNNCFNNFYLTPILLNLFFSFESFRGQSTHAKIQHYEGVTTEDCGITREETPFDDSCFVWHKSDHAHPQILNAMPAPDGTMPFTVRFLAYFNETNTRAGFCTGTIINPNWVITAKHCFELCGPQVTDKCNIVVHAGITKQGFLVYNVTKVVKPNPERDLALLKMDSPIDTSDKSRANSICLPKPYITNNNTEYGLIVGWGLTNETVGSDGRRIIDLPRERPRIGWTVIMEDDFLTSPDTESLFTRPVPFPGGARGCSGDSGGPLIQYSNGRAVLIGVFSTGNKANVKCEETDAIFEYERVSQHLKEIIMAIKEN